MDTIVIWLCMLFAVPCVIQFLICRFARSWAVRLAPTAVTGALWILSLLHGYGIVDLPQLNSLTTVIHVDVIDLFPFSGVPVLIGIGFAWLFSYLANEAKNET